MLMMFIMHVRVRVSHRFMDVLMLMTLSQMQPNPDCHEGTGNCELGSDWFAKREDCRDAAEKRCCREVGTSPRRAEVTQGNYEQGQAHAISEEADHASD
jgi:hypothetical protein